MAPPDLAAYTPVADVFHPVSVCVFPFSRVEYDFTVSPGFESLFGKWLHFYEPLIAQIRLNDCLTAVTVSDRVNHLFFTLKKACFSQVFDYKFACLLAFEAAVFFRNIVVQSSVRVQEVDNFKIVAFSNFPVVRVMCRCDFYHTCSEFFIYVRICNNRDFFAGKWQFEHFANQAFVTLVIRVYGNGCITKECLRAGCCNFDFAASICIFIIKVVHCTLSVNVVNFIICKGGSTARTPVYKTLAFVHKSALIQSYENITNSF